MRAVRQSAALLAAVGLLAAAAGRADDRIAISGNGESLTGTNGGGGGSLSWLHNFDPDTLAAVAVEHQVLSVSQWTFGSLSAAFSGDSGSNQRYTVSGEAHEGRGRDGGHDFTYAIEALGLSGTYFHRATASLEDRQVNVEATHGNLPKAGLSYLWNPHFQTQIAYQYSFGGNLGTRLTSGRIDIYGTRVNFLAGGAIGQASPTILGVEIAKPATRLKEGYVGLSKPLPRLRSELTLIVDYLWLSGGTTVADNVAVLVPASERWTGTLNYIFHVGGKKR